MKYALLTVCILLVSCNVDPRGKALCDCWFQDAQGPYVAVYILGDMGISKADSDCKMIQSQIQKGIRAGRLLIIKCCLCKHSKHHLFLVARSLSMSNGFRIKNRNYEYL